MGQWVSVIKAVYAEMNEHKLTLIAAGVAFYGLLALFPAIGALMAMAGMVANPAQVTDTLSGLSGIMPQAAQEIIIGQAREVSAAPSDGLGMAAIVGLLVTLYSASKGMQALIDGMNLINEREDERGFIRQTLLKLALTLGLLLGILLCVGVAVVIPMLLAALPLSSSAETTLTIARWPILLVIAGAGIALTYRVAPAGQNLSWRWIAPGAALACFLWLIGTAAFALYVRLFDSYQETFGALGGVVILLMWLWVSATVVLLGALVSKILRERSQGEAATA